MMRFGFVLRRLVQTVPLLLGIVFLTFMLLKVTPGDPARLLVGPRAPQAAVDAKRTELGLDQSTFEQFRRYVSGVAHGDLGESLRGGEPVSEIIARRYAATFWLLLAGMTIALAISVPLAIAISKRPDGLLDHSTRVGTLVGLSMPTFWVGIVLILLVALRVDFFPTGGFGGSTATRFRQLILPGLTLAFALVPLLTRSLRTSMIDVRQSDYVAAARSVGVRGSRLTRRFVLRNSIIPTVSLIAVQLGFMLFGVVVVENTFDIPGLGQAMILAATQRDFAVVQGLTLVFAIVVVAVNLLADVTLAILDPRVTIK